MNTVDIVIHRPSGDTIVTYEQLPDGGYKQIREVRVTTGDPIPHSDYLPDGRLTKPPPVLDIENLPVAESGWEGYPEAMIRLMELHMLTGQEFADYINSGRGVFFSLPPRK